MHRLIFHVGFLTFLFCSLCAEVHAEDVLTIRNDTDGSAELWVWPEPQGRWVRPPLFLPRQSTVGLHYSEGMRYWLVALDNQRRETPIGWVDIGAEMRKNPGVELRLLKVFETAKEEVLLWDLCRRRWVRTTIWYKVGKVVTVWHIPKERGDSER